MAETVKFPLDFEATAAYRSVDRLAAYTQKRFSNMRVGASGNNMFSGMDRQARAFGRTLEFANDRMVAFAATTTIVYGLGKAFLSLYNNAIKAEKALADIQVNVKLTTSEMTKLTADLFKAANATGNSFYAAAEAAAEFGRQGLKAADIAKATHAALVLTQISGMDAAASVRSLTAAINTFGKSAVSYESIVNKMAAADTNFAVSSKDLADAISRVGSTAKDAGVSVDELLAIVTSLQQTTARGGAVIGNSLKTIFTRLQREDVAAAIENIGIKTKDADGKFLNQIGVLRELAGVYDKLSDSQKSVISEKLGGVYQINIVKGIIQDLSKSASTFDQALGVVTRAQNEAFLKSEFLGRTAVNRINEAKNSFIALAAAIGKIGLNSAVGDVAGLIKDIGNTLSDGLDKDFDSASWGEKIGQSAVKGLINAISGPGLAALAVGFAKLGYGIIQRFKTDVGGTFIGRGVGLTRAKMEQTIEENRLKLVSIQNERALNDMILRGNGSLQQRLAIMTRLNAGGMSMPVVSMGALKAVKPGKTAASGMLPAMSREASDIARGIGGAGKSAKPVGKKIKMAPGRSENVVVNSHEVVVRDYMGSGADAVFNKEMIRQAGGLSKIASLGKVEHVRGGAVSSYAGGLTNKLSQMGKKDLDSLYLKSLHRRGRGDKSLIAKAIIKESAFRSGYSLQGVRAGNYDQYSTLPIASKGGNLGSAYYSVVTNGLSKERIEGVRKDLRASFSNADKSFQMEGPYNTPLVKNVFINPGDQPQTKLQYGTSFGELDLKSFKKHAEAQAAINSAYRKLGAKRPINSAEDSFNSGFHYNDKAARKERIRSLVGQGYYPNVRSALTHDDRVSHSDFGAGDSFRLHTSKSVSSIFANRDKIMGADKVLPNEIAVANSSQIKFADTITRDVDGRIILPSQRFNKDSKRFTFASGYIPNFAKGWRETPKQKRERLKRERAGLPSSTPQSGIPPFKIPYATGPYLPAPPMSVSPAYGPVPSILRQKGQLPPAAVPYATGPNLPLAPPLVSPAYNNPGRQQQKRTNAQILKRQNAIAFRRNKSRFQRKKLIFSPPAFSPGPRTHQILRNQMALQAKLNAPPPMPNVGPIPAAPGMVLPMQSALSPNQGVRSLVGIMNNVNLTDADRKNAQRVLLNKKNNKGKLSNQYTSVNQGFPAWGLSNSALVSLAKNNPKSPGYNEAKNEIRKRGILRDANMINKGVPLSLMHNSAVRQIAENKGGKFSALQTEGANNERAKRIEAVREKLAYRTLKKNDKLVAMRENNAAASSNFSSKIHENPLASNKQINKMAVGAMSATGGMVNSKEIQAAQKRARINRWQDHSGKVGGKAMMAVMGGSMVGDLLGAPQVGNALSTMGVGAMVGSSFGKYGTAAGILIASTLALSAAVKKSSIPFEKLQANITSLSADAEKYQGSIQGYFSAKQDFQTIIKDPDATATDIKTASRKQAISLAELPSDVRTKLMAADEKDKTSIGNEFIIKQQSRVNAATALGTIATNADKNNSGMGILGRRLGNGNGAYLKLDREELDKSINSFVANYDMEGLKEIAEKGGVKGVGAKEALSSFEAGDFQGFLKANRGLDIVPEKILKDALLVAMGANIDDMNSAFKSGAKSVTALDIAAKEKAEQMKRIKVAFEDFSTFQQSFNKKTALDSTISSTANSLMSARLGIVGNQESTPESIKQAISYSQEIGGLNQQENQLKAKASLDLMKVVGDSYSDSGRNALNDAGGADFIAKFLKGSINGDNIDSSLEAIVKASEQTVKEGQNVSAFTKEQKGDIMELNSNFTNQLFEIKTAKQIALEQLKALQEISRKQQFDKLIDSFRNRDTADTAFGNMEFEDLRNQLFNPTSKDRKREEKERVQAVSRRNSSPLIRQIQEKAELANDFLKLSDEKISRGERGASPQQKALANLMVLRGKTVEQLDIEADGRSNEIKGRGLSTSPFAREAIKTSQLQIAGGLGGEPGTLENVNKAIKTLTDASLKISNPQNEDRKTLESLIRSFTQTKQSIAGASGANSEEKLIIAELIKQVSGELKSADSGASKSIAKSKLDSLSEADRQLNSGNLSAALAEISKFSTTDSTKETLDLIEKAKSGIKNTTVKDQDNALNNSAGQKGRDDSKITDWSAVLGNSSTTIKDSNKLLTDAVSGLKDKVTYLAGVMDKEARIAGKSVEYSDLGLRKKEAEDKLKAASEIVGAKVISSEEWDTSSEMANRTDVKSLFKDSDLSLTPEYASAALNLERILKSGTASGKVGHAGGVKDVEVMDQSIETLRNFFEAGSAERNLFNEVENKNFRIYREAAIGDLPTEKEKEEIGIADKIVKAIEALMEKKSKEIQTLRDEKVVDPTTASNNITINVPLGMEQMSEDIRNVVAKYIQVYNQEPNLAGAFLG